MIWTWFRLARSTYRGKSAQELDVAAVLHRRPELALVDQLAHAFLRASPEAVVPVPGGCGRGRFAAGAVRVLQRRAILRM